MLLVACLIFLVSILLSYFLVGYIIRYAYKEEIYDSENSRKIHHGKIPRVGGAGFILAAIIVVVLTLIVLLHMNPVNWFGYSSNATHDILAVLLSVIIVYVFGIFDDLLGVGYRTKFSYQIITGMSLSLTGFCLMNLHGVLGFNEIPSLFSCLITVFMLVLIINSYNFIDGIDGLASGIAILSFLYYTVILVISKNITFLLSLVFLGAVIPFFYFNVFGKEKDKSKAFMGDTGSTTLGLVLFVFALIVNKSSGMWSADDVPIAWAFAPLLIPCYDVVNVVLLRISMGKNPFKADKNHFHHKLLMVGLTQHQALLIELSIVVIVAFLTILLSRYLNINAILFVSVILWIMINMLLTKIINKKHNNFYEIK